MRFESSDPTGRGKYHGQQLICTTFKEIEDPLKASGDYFANGDEIRLKASDRTESGSEPVNDFEGTVYLDQGTWKWKGTWKRCNGTDSGTTTGRLHFQDP